LKIDDINKIYIYSSNEEVKNYFISNFDSNLYNFLSLKNNDFKDVNSLVVLALKNDKNFYRFYKYINSDFGYYRNFNKNGDFLIGIFGERIEDLKFNIYKNKYVIDSILESRIYEIAYKRATYFGIDEEKQNLIKREFNIIIDIPIGWQIKLDNSKIITFTKRNPDRIFRIYFPEYIMNLDFEGILKLRNELFKDSVFDLKISKKTINKLCFDGKVIQGFFRTCAGYLENKFYLYDIKIIDSSINKPQPYILEIDAILSNIRKLY